MLLGGCAQKSQEVITFLIKTRRRRNGQFHVWDVWEHVENLCRMTLIHFRPRNNEGQRRDAMLACFVFAFAD